MNPNSYSKIGNIEKNEIIELNRLWIDDKLGKNAETIMLGACWKLIKSNYPRIKLVQSFADGRLGCGTIYKAANFKYYGFHKTLFIENLDTKEVFHNVCFTDASSIRTFSNSNKLILDDNYTCFKVKTYRYIYKLDKKAVIYLKEKPYPQYDKGVEPATFIPSDNMLGKLYWIYKTTNQMYYANKAASLIRGDVDDVISSQQHHKYVESFILKYKNKELSE